MSVPVQHAAHGDEPMAAVALTPLMRDFLAWVADRPRCYAEAMAAWRSSCPRYTIWEDAIGEDLVRLDYRAGTAMRETMVTLTPRGQALINGH